VLDLALASLGVGEAEIAANGGAAHVQAQPRRPALQGRQVRGGRFREVIAGELDGVEGLLGGVVDKVEQPHRRLGLLQVQGLAEAVGGQTQTHPGLPMRRIGSMAGACDAAAQALRASVEWRNDRRFILVSFVK